jgi:5'-nucleotidase
MSYGLRVFLFFYKKGKNIKGQTLVVNNSIAFKEEIEKEIFIYKKKIDQDMREVISYAPKSLTTSDGKLESTLGNLLADLSYKRGLLLFKDIENADIDFSIFNYGGIRTSISKGNVTKKNIYELFPFEDSYIVVEVTGDKILELSNYLIKNERTYSVSKEFNLVYKEEDFLLKIKKQALNLTKTYFVLTTDYVESIENSMPLFINPINIYRTDCKVRDAMITEFTKIDALRSSLDGRLKK